MISHEELLTRSSALAVALAELLVLTPYDNSPRIISSRTLCGVSFEHAESVRILIATGYFTSSLGVLRMQYEALVKAVWSRYAAPDSMVGRLLSELNLEAEKLADKVPSLGDMLGQLAGKAPAQAIEPLVEFKEYSWKALSSYIHGGIHAINRHSTGYPVPLLSQAAKSSNGLLMMTGMMLIILCGDTAQSGKISTIQRRFADCLPPAPPIA